MTMRILVAGICVAGAAWVPGIAQAVYPEKPIRFLVPYPPGGAGDLMGRSLAQKLGDRLGQTLIVDNRAGASGTLAAEATATAAPDGYTLMGAAMQTHVINVSLIPNLRYDAIKDFTPISLTHTLPRVLVVNASVPARNVADLIALAKKSPGTLTYSSAGNGSTGQLAGELFKQMTGVDMVHVPYKGSGPAVNDLLAGRISLTFDSVVVWGEHIRTGKVRALGATSLTRMGTLPDVPTIAEQGLAGYEMSNWFGMVGPANLPRDIVTRLNADIGRTMADPELRKTLLGVAIEPQFSTPEEFAAIIRNDIARWGKVVKGAGMKID
jgi:tripartite-type tricarboxylate transporter receptor subunit TctC